MSYFAPDCFHLSEKGQAAAALALWNNMVSPVPDKDTQWAPGQDIKCPSPSQPYLYTNHNSQPGPRPVQPARASQAVSVQVLTAITVSGLVLFVLGSILLIAVYRWLQQRQLYVQIPK